VIKVQGDEGRLDNVTTDEKKETGEHINGWMKGRIDGGWMDECIDG
jgi:hypothetical protein